MKVGPKSSLRPFLHRALQLSKLDLLPDLKSGITQDIFNWSGTIPELNDKFIMWDNGLAIT